jgi:uncharacterized lipoprotein YajG
MRASLLLCAAVLLMAGCGKTPAPPNAKATNAPAAATEGEKLAIASAKKAVAANDDWANEAVYEVKPDGEGWTVLVQRIVAYDREGNPMFAPGGNRLVRLDKTGKVTEYMRGQ